MGKWYDTGFKDGRDGQMADPPMNPGHRSHEDYRDGFKDGMVQAERDEMQTTDLDDAQDAFERDPSAETAGRYSREAGSCRDRGAISASRHGEIMDETGPYLETPKPL